MQTFKFISLLALIVFSFSCKNINKPNNLVTKVNDTIIYTIPNNYLKALDTTNPAQIIAVNSYVDILKLFKKYNYTPETWNAGIREVPRLYITEVGDKWGKLTDNEITVNHKKQVFFRGMAPLVLRANELIMKDRSRLNKIILSYQNNNTITKTDKKWIDNLSQLYEVNENNDQEISAVLDELWQRVDIIPPSLALAQGAEESGWGTSRFAGLGNALYGQWSWGENIITPKKQRKELGNYGIAAFATIQEAVCAYMLNINTHNTYASLREKRAELRKNNQPISGYVLAEQLTKYSERGAAYVKGLHALMDYNHLAPADDAYLSNKHPVFLVSPYDFRNVTASNAK